LFVVLKALCDTDRQFSDIKGLFMLRMIDDVFAIERRRFVCRKHSAALGAGSSSPNTRMFFVLA
jgi:hypothetical protein